MTLRQTGVTGRSVCVCAAAAVILSACLGQARADTGVQLRTVALTGQPAPGTPDGVTFLALTTGLNHSFMHPVIDEQGRVAFIAFLTGPGVGAGNQTGIWSEAGGELSLVVRTGMPAPGTPPGVVFQGVPSEYIPFPPSSANGQAGFQGDLAGPGVTFNNEFGIWVEQPLEPVLIARAGDPAPGLEAGVVFGTIGFLGSDEDGHSTIMGTVSGPGVTSSNNEAVWSNRSGEFSLLYREGDPAPGTASGVTLGLGVFANTAAFEQVRRNDLSLLAIQANLLGPGVDAFNDEALFVEDAVTGELTLVAREGDFAPGMPGNQDYGGGSVTADFDIMSLDDAGHVSFRARVGSSAAPILFSDHNGALAPVFVPGDTAPGTNLPFGFAGGALLSDNGRIAFRASLPDDDNDPFTQPPFGIWTDRTGTVLPAALPEQIVTHGGLEWTLEGTVFIVGFSDAGEIAYTGYISRPDVQYPNHAVLISGPSTTHVVVANDDMIDLTGDGSDLRQVLRIQHGGLSETGVVAFRLDFTDGSSGHFAAAVDCDGDGVSDAREIADGTAVDANGNGLPDACEGAAGDVNCDGVVDLADIDAFAMALVDPAGYGNAFPGCTLSRADLNGDAAANGADIDGFVTTLLGT